MLNISLRSRGSEPSLHYTRLSERCNIHELREFESVRGHDAAARRAAVLPHPAHPPSPPRSLCAHVPPVPANTPRSFICLQTLLFLSAAMTSANDADAPLNAAPQPQEQVGRARDPDRVSSFSFSSLGSSPVCTRVFRRATSAFGLFCVRSRS